jgi:CheY-like chemotaxis protein
MRTRVLIVDDMPEALVMLMAYLSGEGYDVMTAQNGAEALSLLSSNTPDVIISDIMMPKMGGFEFIDKLRRNFATNTTPIIFMSAKNRTVAEKMAIDLGAAAFLEKPVSLTVVKAAIDAAVKKAALEKAEPSEETILFENKRQHARAQFICEAYFEGGGISGLTVASNISMGGLFLDTFSNIPVGTLLHLRLKLHPGCEIETIGEVCYNNKGVGVGVKFLAIDNETAQMLQDTVTQALTRQRQHAQVAM